MFKFASWIAVGLFAGVGSMAAVAATHHANSAAARATVSAGTFLGANHGTTATPNWQGHHGLMGTLGTDAAQALNIAPSTLKTDLQKGKSLAAIAQAQGSSTKALEATLLKDATAQIQSAVSAGKLTSVEASRLKAHLPTIIKKLVTIPLAHPWGLMAPHRLGFMRPLCTDAAQALNIAPSTLKTDLQKGESLATIAQAQGSSTKALEATLLKDATAQIQSAVSAGKLTSVEASRLKAHLPTIIKKLVTIPLAHPWGLMAPHRMGFMRPLRTDAAQALNISPSTLKTDLQKGESLAAIAHAHGSSTKALEATLLKDATAQIQSALSAGKLTPARATQMESHLNTVIDRWVTGSMHAPGHKWGPGPHAPSAT
ncbi:hypothetical protein [Sulfobacillus harzensis]|uniref:LysM domain-containing protein n=1 Tax=Sulfobacillus harzensis TaxID=2729629 RepID=A0A7Y0L273_9FIRM|nr:hypothetical protein [Sulfobacillus harzensis]NMP21938.1 hypothetical protein [Sulfobacillus harzensis]